MTHQSTANRDPAVAQQIGRDYALGLLKTKSGAMELAYTMLRRANTVNLAAYIGSVILTCDDADSADSRSIAIHYLQQMAIQTVSNQAYENAFAGDAQRSVASLTVPVPTLDYCDNEQVDATLRSRIDGLGLNFASYNHYCTHRNLLREFCDGLRCAGATIKPAFYDALKRAEDAACQKFGIPF
jgi:hypothetical protein